jgi:DNA mismatch endonuclease, patch repair protein
MALRRELHGRGMRFRVHRHVGTTRPDVVFTRAKVAVFVMGDFWHSCPRHGTRPKANAEWWATKLAANTARDERQRDELQAAGWLVVWVWECEDPARAAALVHAQWQTRSGRPATCTPSDRSITLRP